MTFAASPTRPGDRPHEPASKTRIEGLDTLRAAAILLVFMYHYMVFVSHAPTFGWGSILGWTGVDLFFVLSGYLIGNQIFACGCPESVILRRSLTTALRRQKSPGETILTPPQTKTVAAAPPNPTQDCLKKVTKPPAFDTVLSRDLTRTEARDCVLYLISQGKLTYNTQMLYLSFTKDCKPIYPRPSDHLQIKPGNINGVDFVNLVSSSAAVIDNCDVRIVVMLYRLTVSLSQFVSTKFPAYVLKEIHHLGIGHGNANHPDDCHNTGRALDFAGCVLKESSGSGVVTLNIQKHWGSHDILLPNGTTVKTWPSGSTFEYRLEQGTPSTILEEQMARDIFKSVYQFATQDAVDTSAQQTPFTDRTRTPPTVTPSTIGSGFQIIHPDYPNDTLRAQHQDHIHFQIATTGLESAPPP